MTALGMPFSKIYPPLDAVAGPWSQTLKPREKQVLGYTLLTAEQSGKPRPGAVDVYQSLGRAFTAEPGFVPSLCPSQRCWLLHGTPHPRFLLGGEAMELQAFPTALISDENLKYAAGEHGCPDSLCSDIAGNMFTGSDIMALQIATLTVLKLVDVDAGDDSDGDASDAAEAGQEDIDSVLSLIAD